MLWFWRTLVADAYPLICPVASSPTFDQNQSLEPGCWFSKTIGLSAASVELAGTIKANRPSRAVTTIRLSLIDAAPSPQALPAPYLQHDVEVAALTSNRLGYEQEVYNRVNQ